MDCFGNISTEEHALIARNLDLGIHMYTNLLKLCKRHKCDQTHEHIIILGLYNVDCAV